MNAETEGLIGHYLDWLRENSYEREVDDGWKELTLPFLDHHNDHLQVYVRREDDGLRITDDGRTIRDLKHVGCDLKAPWWRRVSAEYILRGLGLSSEILETGMIATTATDGEFPHKLHSIVLAMLAFDGFAYTSPP